MRFEDIGIVTGTIYLKSGKASNILKDDQGIIKKWDFDAKNLISKVNQIAYTGLSFVLQRGWGVSAAIALGNGGTVESGVSLDPVSPLSIKLSNEINVTTPRFEIIGDAESRVKEGVVVLSTLWLNDQGYTGEITEFGIFATLPGQPILGRESGKLVSRVLQSFTRSAGEDVEIVWILDFTV